MLAINAKIRSTFGKKVKALRKKGILPAILYGPKIQNLPLEVNLKEFMNIYQKAGETSLINLTIENKNEKKYSVLIHDIKKDPLTGTFLHVDFYQPILTEEVEVIVPLVFEGIAPAVKELGGTLIKHISELEIKALPQHIPHEIKVNVQSLKTFEDEILIKDLKLPKEVKVLRKPEEIIANVIPPEKVEEELEEPIEEKVEEIEKVEEKKEEESENKT